MDLRAEVTRFVADHILAMVAEEEAFITSTRENRKLLGTAVPGMQGHAVLAWRPEPIRRRVSGASVR
jgi:hypothetical protein